MRTSLRMWSAPAPRRGLRSWWLPVLLWLASVSAWAQATTIGSTTIPVASPATSTYLYGPIYRSANDAGSTFDYSRYAYLYTAAELGIPTGSVITELAWLKSDAGAVTGNNTFTVWLENSTTTTLGTTQTWSAISATATQVYTSTSQQVTGGAGSYFIVTLSQPFTYTGGSLVVLTDWVKQGSATAAVNFVTNSATGLGLGAANSTALSGTTALTTSYGNRRPTLRLTHGACTAPPTAGTTSASSTALCAPTTVSFGLQGSSYGSGLTYQWQSSTNGTTYTNISGATSASYSAPVSATTYFRAVVTCSGQSANSAPVQVTFTSPTYATLPYAQGFDNAWIDACGTRDVPTNNWRMTASATDADASWRRDDDGAAGNWTSPTFGAYSPVASQGTNSARFHSSYGTSGTVGTLDLYVNLSAAGTKQLTFDYINTSGSDSLTVHLSTDGGVTFGPALLSLRNTTTWTPQVITTTSTSATAVIRFRGRSDFGSTDIGLDNVNLGVITACTAPPAAGTAVANTTSICFPTAIDLSLSGVSPAITGLSYQWQSSTNGTTYTNISGATNRNYTSAPVSATTYFRVVVTCSGQSANSAPVQVTFTSPTYATLPYAQNFDNAWVDVCGTRDVPSNNWRAKAAPTDADASWRRDDDGAAGNWTSPTFGAYSPAFSQGTNSARFHSYNATAGTVGTLDLYVNLSAAGTKQLTFDYINTSGSDSLTVHLSTDGGVTFGPALLRLNTAAAWGARAVSISSTSATAVIRFRGRGDLGSTDIGLDNVNLTILPTCTTPPTAGTAVASVTSICAPRAVNLSLTGVPALSGLTYQWQSSTNGTTYTNISGATNPTYTTAPVTATTYFRAVVTCSGQSANSTPVQVTLNAPTYATLPGLENFDNAWIDVCATREVPTNSWRMTASATDADASWRRDDDGAAGNWTSPTFGAYSPAFSQGTNSARFHSSYGTSGTVGTLDYYVNLSASGNKRLTFDYINTSGTDSLTVHLSTDGGVTFGPALLRLNTAAAWTNQALPITSTSATTVIRFRGRSDFGSTDIGIDNVRVESVTGCLSPAGLTVGTTTSTTAVLSWVNSGSGNYTVEYGPIGFTLGNGTQVTGITGTTTTLTGLTPGTPYQFYVIQNCGSTTSAAGGPVVFNTQITNDDPAGAITLNVATACTPVSGTNVGATTTTASGYTNPGSSTTGCGTATQPKDVWYKFTTSATGPTSTAVRITVTGTPASQVRAFSATSAAGPFTQIGCSANSSTSVAPNLDLTALSPSTTYYVRVSGFANADVQGAFTICAALLPNCQDPVVPTVSSTTSSTASIYWGGVQTSGSTYELEYGPQGFTLGGGTRINGIPSQTTTLTALSASTNYCFYVRQNCGTVNGLSAWVGPICFTTDAGAATNDEPCNALPFTINSTGTITNLVGTTLGATTTSLPGIVTPACSPALSPKDVWFRITLPAGVTSLSGNFRDNTAGMVRLFTAATCSTGFSQVACQASSGNNQAVGNVNFTGLTAGATYYMAVSGYGSNDTRGQFSIIIQAQKNQLAGGDVAIFPNPVVGGAELNVQISGAKSGALHCEILNALGQVVQTRTAEVRNGNLQQTLTTTGLAKGLYQVRLRIGSDVMVQKVMVD